MAEISNDIYSFVVEKYEVKRSKWVPVHNEPILDFIKAIAYLKDIQRAHKGQRVRLVRITSAREIVIDFKRAKELTYKGGKHDRTRTIL